MADKVINVTVSSVNTKNVTISSKQVANEISATADSSVYYSQLAKNWAIGEGLIQNEDYSSKTYAGVAQEAAESAQGSADTAQAFVNDFSGVVDNAITEIDGVKTEALTAVTSSKDLALSDISATQSSALSDISASQAETLVKISDAKIDALNEINSSVEGYKSSALDVIEAKSIEEQAVIVAIKDDVLNSTNDASDYKEEAKYWAEKAKDNSGIYYDEIAEQDISVSILEAGYVTNETLNETIGDISTVLDDILGGV